jgi:AcrR family transcriptional regulator
MSPRSAKAIRGRVGGDPATALREHLIDAAERLLTERQFSTITTRDIARAAQVSDGVLYNYFSDKSELLIAALVRRYAAALAAFEVGLPTPGVGVVEENLTYYARAALELVSSTLPMAAGLVSEPTLLHRFLEAIHTEPYGPHRIREPMAEYLLGEQRLGRLGEFEIEPVLALLVGPALVLGLGGLVAQRPLEELATQIPGVVAALLRGLAPRA